MEKKIENPLSHILVITFTQKAANEMKERILKELQANSIETNGQEIWISTFHGFGNKFLKKHSIEASLSPNYKLADEETLKKSHTYIEPLSCGTSYEYYMQIKNFKK